MAIKHMHKADRPLFMDGDTIDRVLSEMEHNNELNTQSVPVIDGMDSVKMVTFHEKHAGYLRTHPKINPQNYLSNLRAMIKIRP